MIKEIFTDKKYMSEIMNELPSNCLLNKGITGCGGTHLELTSKRNSLILVPHISLALNKMKEGYLIIYGKTTEIEIKKYIKSSVKYKKIIGTYDALPKILDIFPGVIDYFLLIDEYHLLFNIYTFRDKAVLSLLSLYNKFKNYCFMSATPLNDDIILDEIKHIPKINIIWEKAIPAKIKVINSTYTNKSLITLLSESTDCNYHIFINSLQTIKEIIEKLDTDNYKVVCSDRAKRANKTLIIGSTLSPVKKYNFYTSTAFEGCDIYDEKGKTIILCDTKISTTILDISTLIRQIIGRIRNSIYKDSATLILNTTKHRYAGISEEKFKLNVKENIEIGKYKEFKFNTDSDELYKQAELRSFSKEAFHSFYVNKIDNKIFYDDNLRKRDEYNYKLIESIYNSSISVISEINNNEMVGEEQTSNWIKDKLNDREYSYSELEELFKLEFPIFSGKIIKDYFPPFTKKRKTKNKIKEMYYQFEL